ncbi:DUF481 domain-containing protein [Pedobacter sp. SYSU D00535]|uniref:DUF481 domain-containing protein n=1 Tax=Pedobacter sp. SYSU D00535 TaxID=2810308 RepID=UPI001A97A798|nr:DUF481 domain-containing protein [Pedobacter sp. SYSU D00535]
MLKHVLSLSLLLNVLTAFAQFNDSTHHFLRLASSGNLNRTNTSESHLLNNNLRFSIKKKKISLNTTQGWVYGKQNDKLSNNDYSSYIDFNVHPWGPKFYYWGLGNYTSSFSLKIEKQIQTGLGLAYNFIETERNWLNLSNGLLYEASDLRLSSGEDEQYQTLRNSFRLAFRFRIGEVVIFEGSGYLQNSLNSRSDYIIRSTTGISIRLNRWLNLNSSLGYNRITRTDRENLLLSYGLALERYF